VATWSGKSGDLGAWGSNELNNDQEFKAWKTVKFNIGYRVKCFGRSWDAFHRFRKNAVRRVTQKNASPQ